ncbi:hypothetical protein FRB99_001573, partial [Tulasnella sp. 403]
DFMAEISDSALAVETRNVYRPFGVYFYLATSPFTSNVFRLLDSLPNELVIEILRLAVKAADSTADPDTRRDIRSSFACEVSSVSRRWKTLALVVPELWSFVYLPKPSLSDSVFDHINVFCARSPLLPMHGFPGKSSTTSTDGAKPFYRACEIVSAIGIVAVTQWRLRTVAEESWDSPGWID